MINVKSAEGVPYDAPGHYGCFGLMKFTKEHTKRTIINYSYFHPNGGIEMSAAAPVERVYCVIKGSITAKGKNGGVHIVNAGDMIYIAPGEEREVTVNDGNPAEILVVVTEV